MALTPRQLAKRLNDQQDRYGAGFYLSSGHRCFQARVRKGVVEVKGWPYDPWFPLGQTQVTDHNGRHLLSSEHAPVAPVLVRVVPHD